MDQSALNMIEPSPELAQSLESEIAANETSANIDFLILELKAQNLGLFLTLWDDDNRAKNRLLKRHPDISASEILDPYASDRLFDLHEIVVDHCRENGIPKHLGKAIRYLMRLNTHKSTNRFEAILDLLAMTFLLVRFTSGGEHAMKTIANRFSDKVSFIHAINDDLKPTVEEIEQQALSLGFAATWADTLGPELDKSLNQVRKYRLFPPYRWLKSA